MTFLLELGHQLKQELGLDRNIHQLIDLLLFVAVLYVIQDLLHSKLAEHACSLGVNLLLYNLLFLKRCLILGFWLLLLLFAFTLGRC